MAKLPKGNIVDIFDKKDGWLRIGPGRWVSANYVEIIFTTRWVRIISRTAGDVRESPAVNVPVIDALPNGIWTTVIGETENWYALGPKRWIQKAVTEPLVVRNGQVTGTPDLNVRLGPGTSYGASHRLQLNDPVQIFGEQDGWLRIAHREWVSARYITIL